MGIKIRHTRALIGFLPGFGYPLPSLHLPAPAASIIHSTSPLGHCRSAPARLPHRPNHPTALKLRRCGLSSSAAVAPSRPLRSRQAVHGGANCPSPVRPRPPVAAHQRTSLSSAFPRSARGVVPQQSSTRACPPPAVPPGPPSMLYLVYSVYYFCCVD